MSAQNVDVCMKGAVLALRYAAARGVVDVERVARGQGLDPAELGNPFGRVPHAVLVALWTELPRLLDDPAFGLHAAEALHDRSHDAVDYAVFHCMTARDAMERLSRYQRLLHEGGEVRLAVEGGRARYTQRFDVQPPAPRHFVEFVFAMWTLRFRQHLRRPLPVFEVSFEHAAPADTSEHRRLFDAPLRFAAPANAIVFDAALLEAPMAAPDPMLSLVMERQMEELLAKLPQRDDFLGELRRELARELVEGPPDLDRAARAMRTSARTLQRRLHEAGTTFQAFADDVRRDLTVRRLAEPSATITEVAFMAGFSDVSAFHRAFRRWTGNTPAEYRKRTLAAGA